MTTLALKMLLSAGVAASVLTQASVISHAADDRVATSPAQPSVSPRTAEVAARRQEGASVFAARIIRLASTADAIDGSWRSFKKTCEVRLQPGYDFGREWFGLWDRSVESRSDAPCTEALQGLLQRGGALAQELAAAQAEAARAHVPDGTVQGMVRWHGLQWPAVENGRRVATR